MGVDSSDNKNGVLPFTENDQSEKIGKIRKKFPVKNIIFAILTLAYFAYLGYAVYYDIQKAKPLLISTALFIFGLFYVKIFSPAISKQDWFQTLKNRTEKLFECLQNVKYANYAFYLLVLSAIAAFLVWDTWGNWQRLTPLGGVGFVVVCAVVLSIKPSKINWRPVMLGFFLQFFMGLIALKWSTGLKAFEFISLQIVEFLKYATYGTNFVYGFLSAPPNLCGMSPVFAFTVLQVIIYFGSVVALLYYFGVIQFVLRIFARLMQITMGITSAESFYAVGCIVLGQSEAPILITPYLAKLTRSELNTIMTVGFSCIAGSVFAAYVALGACPFYILSACLMSSPASVAISKILLPELEESQLKNESDLELPKSQERNAIEAISNGASSVIGVVFSICANLIVFLAILYFIDDLVKYLASLVGLDIGFQALLGYAFFPIAFTMGVSDKNDWGAKMNETMAVARLMGTKTVLNEFIAYERLGEMIASGELSGRAQMMATYALCSFSNFCSIGVQMGILGSLCPEKKGLVAQTIMRALLGGCLCCILTACIAVKKQLTAIMAEKCASKRNFEDLEPEEMSVEKKQKLEGENSPSSVNAVQRVKYDKYAMFVSFCGQGFYGMQINGDTPTIERELLAALEKCGLVDDEDCRRPGGKLAFQRAARTDKSVSAVKQMCSLKLPRPAGAQLNSQLLDQLNVALPAKIRIWGFTKATHGFNAKNSCDNRTYSYTLPSVALAPSVEILDHSFRITKDQLEKTNEILAMFKGTLNFYNFTYGKKPGDRSCIRYIMACSCGDPFIVDNVEFVTVTIRGQSFMVHQIRKIIGFTVAILRGFAEKSLVQKALSNKNRVDIPKAPGLGLVLQEVHYDAYNKRYEKTHEKLSWVKYQAKVDEFRRDQIEKSIVDTEIRENCMVEWLNVLHKHSFTSTNDEPSKCVDESAAKISCGASSDEESTLKADTSATI